MTTTTNLPAVIERHPLAVPGLRVGDHVRVTVEVPGLTLNGGVILEHRPDRVKDINGYVFTALEDFVVALIINGEIEEMAFARHELTSL